MDEEVAKLTSAGNAFEMAGRHDLAETAYLRSIELVDPRDTELIGTIHINLGTNAAKHGRETDAIAYLSKAIALLDSCKGEAILQSAHAHLNLCDIYINHSDPRAVTYVEQALVRYRKYPYTSLSDIADAMATQVIANAFCKHEVSQRLVMETWKAMLKVNFSEMEMRRVKGFLGILLPMVRDSDPELYSDAEKELRIWASPQFASNLLDGVNPEVTKRPYSQATTSIIGRCLRMLIGR